MLSCDLEELSLPFYGVWRTLFFVCGLGLTLLRASEQIHTVQKGETLYKISREYGVSVREIVEANPEQLGGGRVLKPGETLQIPSGSKPTLSSERVGEKDQDGGKGSPVAATEFYVVRKGDTLSSVARKFSISSGELRDLNHLSSSDLDVGQRLRVRRSAVKSPSKAATKLAAVSKVTPSQAAESHPDTSNKKTAAAPPAEGKPHYLFIDKIKDQIDAPHVVPGRWKYVVVHHSGTPSGNAKIFDYFHRNIRGMENGLAYHFVIGNGHDSGDGEIEVGNRWLKQLQGGHLHSDELNMISIGICFVGDFNTERPTRKQIAAAIELITYLNQICGTPPIFKAHREINPRPTECPGKNFPVRAFHELFDRPQ